MNTSVKQKQAKPVAVKPHSSEMTMEPDFGTEQDMAEMWDEDRIDISAENMTLEEMLDYLFTSPVSPEQTLPLGDETSRTSCISCYHLRSVMEASVTGSQVNAPDLAAIFRRYAGEGTVEPKMPVLTRRSSSHNRVHVRENNEIWVHWSFQVHNAEWMDFLHDCVRYRSISVKEIGGHAEGKAKPETLWKDTICYINYRPASAGIGEIEFCLEAQFSSGPDVLEESVANIREEQRIVESTYLYMLEMHHLKLKAVLERLSYAIESAHKLKAIDQPWLIKMRGLAAALDIEECMVEEEKIFAPHFMGLNKKSLRDRREVKIYREGYSFVGYKSLERATDCLAHQVAELSDGQLADENYLIELFTYQPAILEKLAWNREFSVAAYGSIKDWKRQAYRRGAEAATNDILDSRYLIGKRLADKEASRRGIPPA